MFSRSGLAQPCGTISFGTPVINGTTTEIDILLTGHSTDPFDYFSANIAYTNGSNVTFDLSAMNASIHSGLHNGFQITNNGVVRLFYFDTTTPTTLPTGTITLFTIVMDVNPGKCTDLSLPNGGGQNGIDWTDSGNCNMITGGNSNNNCGPSVAISGHIDLIQSTWELEDVDMTVEDITTTPFVAGTDITDSNGEFEFSPLLIGADYKIIPEKNDEVGCGVTSYDSYLIEQHILGYDYLDDKRAKMAADVNLSNTITTYDRSLITNQYNGTSDMPNAWYFITDQGYSAMPFNNSHTVPVYENFEDTTNVTNDITTTYFYAVKTGDVDVSCNPTINFRSPQTLAESRSSHPILLSDVFAKAGETIEIPVRIPDFTGKLMLALSFELDAAVFKNVSLKSGFLTEWSKEQYHIFEKEGKIFINILWSSDKRAGATVAPTQALFYIQAASKRSIFGLEQVLQLGSHRLDDNRVFAPYGDIQPLNLTILPPTTEVSANSPFENTGHQAFPTIVAQQSTFIFELKHPETVELLIVNLNGQIVRQQSFDLAKGQQQITFNDLGNLEPGTFQYYLVANG